LAEKIDFEPYAVFRALDVYGKGYLMKSDLLNFLWRNNCNSSEEDVNNLIDYSNPDGSGRISYQKYDFCSL